MTDNMQTGKARRNLLFNPLVIVIGVAVLAFLAGFLPMWFYARNATNTLRETRQQLLLVQMQTLLGSAAVDARRGNYEPARQATSQFFTRLSAELDRGEQSLLAPVSAEKLAPILAQRDTLITLLARADPASADRLSDLYVTYRGLLPPSAEPGLIDTKKREVAGTAPLKTKASR